MPLRGLGPSSVAAALTESSHGPFAAATDLRLLKKKSWCVPRQSGRWGRQRFASLDHPSVDQFVAGNRATVMGHERLRFEGVARLERLFGLPVHLEDEVALDDETAVDTWMSVTARASARREFHNRSHGRIARGEIDGTKDGTLNASLLCEGGSHEGQYDYAHNRVDLDHWFCLLVLAPSSYCAFLALRSCDTVTY